MSLDPTGLLLSIVLGAIGFGYFRYGKSQSRTDFLVSGIALMAAPYFLPLLWQIAIGAALILAPFAAGRWLDL